MREEAAIQNNVFRLYYLVRLVVSSIWLAGLAVAIFWSLRLARADALYRRATPESVSEAARLAPGNPEYQSLRALQVEYASGDASPLWREMTARRPTDSTYWTQLGLAAEAQNRMDDAEQLLLHAATVNQQYEPRWTLANFYFRRGRKPEFRRWSQLAMERMHDDPRLLFDLCWRFDDPPPSVPASLRSAYVAWLIETQRLDAASHAAEQLRPNEDREAILGASEALLASHPAAAFHIWSKLGFTPSPDFRPLLGRGFDWRIPAIPGVHATPTEEPSLRIQFDGKQAESAELLWRAYPVEPAARAYRVRWQMRTSEIRGESGITWRAADSSVPVTASDSWKDGELVVSSEGAALLRLSLAYRRPSGSPRLEGTLWLRRVVVEAVR